MEYDPKLVDEIIGEAYKKELELEAKIESLKIEHEEKVEELREEIQELKQEAYDKEKDTGQGIKLLGLIIVGAFGFYFCINLLTAFFTD